MVRKPDESMGETGKPTGFPDFMNFFAGLRVPPSEGLGPFLHAQQRNMEVFVAANKVAMEAAQACARRQMEVVQEGLSELTKVLQALAEPGAPEERLKREIELMREAREQSVAAMQELGALIQKSNSEVGRLLSTRFTEAIEEIEAILAKAGPRAP